MAKKDLCKLLVVVLIVYVEIAIGDPNDGNVGVWNYLKGKLKSPDLGEEANYVINTKIDKQTVTITWQRRPPDHATALQRWGFTIRDTANAVNIIQASVEAANRGMINQVDKSPAIKGQNAMNAITKIFCDLNVADAGLHDMATVNHNVAAPVVGESEDLALLQAYKGNGYSWYNKWNFLIPNDAKHAQSKALIKDIKDVFQKDLWKSVTAEITRLHRSGTGFPKDTKWTFGGAYDGADLGGQYDGRWENDKVGNVMFTIWRRRSWAEYNYMKTELRRLGTYTNIIARIDAARADLDNGPPYDCPSAQTFIYYNNHFDDYNALFLIKTVGIISIMVIIMVFCCFGGAVLGWFVAKYKNSKLNFML